MTSTGSLAFHHHHTVIGRVPSRDTAAHGGAPLAFQRHDPAQLMLDAVGVCRQQLQSVALPARGQRCGFRRMAYAAGRRGPSAATGWTAGARWCRRSWHLAACAETGDRVHDGAGRVICFAQWRAARLVCRPWGPISTPIALLPASPGATIWRFCAICVVQRCPIPCGARFPGRIRYERRLVARCMSLSGTLEVDDGRRAGRRCRVVVTGLLYRLTAAGQTTRRRNSVVRDCESATLNHASVA